MLKLLRKVSRKVYDFSKIVELLMCSKSLPETEDALDYLQKVAPNPDGSCWIERDSDYENRSLLLSVIVPAYNVEKYIDNCLDSLLQRQVPFDYEVIVVNDGSTDATAQLLDKYVHNEKVRIIHQKNKGLSGARNTGIACAKGEYLCFIDSDDDVPVGSFESMLSMAVQNRAKLVAQCIFVVQRMLLDRYYDGYQIRNDIKKQEIQNALRKKDFRKYVLACERH